MNYPEELSYPLTYFKDIHDLIYYSKGILAPNGNLISTLVYIPENSEIAQLIQLKSNQKYIKRIIDCSFDKINYSNLSKQNQNYINSRIWMNPESRAKYITVPIVDIKEIYNPRKAFQDAQNEGGIVRVVLNDLRNLFDHVGIANEDCGLYGALQVQIYKTESSKPKDIDVIVYGLDNFKIFKSIQNILLNKYNFKRFDKKFIDTKTYEFRILKNLYRRDKELALIHKSGIKIETKFIRNSKDKKTFPMNFFNNVGMDCTFKGRVINDDEAFTIAPSTFVVKSNSNRVVKVTSLIYLMAGAAFKNEKVNIIGRDIGDNFILLDSPIHYIGMG